MHGRAGTANDTRSEAARLHHRARARRPRQGVLHQRRRGGERERDAAWPGCTPAATRCCRRTAATTARPTGRDHVTGDPRRWPTSRGMPGTCTSSGPYLYRSEFCATTPSRGVRARAAPPRARDRWSKGPAPSRRSCSRRSSARTASSCRRDGYLAGVRAICDEHGIVMIADEVMAGFGRCGEWFAVDRWDVTPDLITLRQGRQLGIRAARRRDHLRADRRRRSATGRIPGGLTYSGHPLACASAVALDQHLRGRGHRRARPHARRRRDRPGAARDRRSAIRSSARCAGSACSGRSSSSATGDREPWCRSTRAGADAAPMGELAAACKSERRLAVHALQPHSRRAAARDHR